MVEAAYASATHRWTACVHRTTYAPKSAASTSCGGSSSYDVTCGRRRVGNWHGRQRQDIHDRQCDKRTGEEWPGALWSHPRIGGGRGGGGPGMAPRGAQSLGKSP